MGQAAKEQGAHSLAMRIAVTADLHLTTRKEHRERFAALEDILRQCGRLGVDWLIIAGDRFDPHRQHSPGPPNPLDINETGLRRFLIFDTQTLVVSEQRVDSPRIYFSEAVVMLPVA